MPRRGKRKVNKSLSTKQKSAVTSIARKELQRNMEWKHNLVSTTDTASTSGFIRDLSAVPQGDTDITRDGDALMASSVDIRYTIFSADNYNVWRVIVFQWHPITTPVVADILNNVASSNVNAFYETDHAHMFKIMYDKTWTLNENVSGTSVALSGRFKVRVPRKQVKYLNTSTTGTNKVYYLLISDSGAASHPGWNFSSKLNYTDA